MGSQCRMLGPVERLNQTISGTTPVSSLPIDVRSMSNAAFSINYGAGLTASFGISASVDGINYQDMGLTITGASGSAGVAVVNLTTLGIAYLMAVVTPSSGSGTVVITASAKG